MNIAELADSITRGVKELAEENETLRGELAIYKEACKYMGDPHNWINEDGWLQMKRPGGGGQKGIILTSHDLNPCVYLSAIRGKK